MNTVDPPVKRLKDTMKRSIIKSLSYRLLIIVLDFTTVYLITGQAKLALGFMLVSNIYTTVAYFFHERIWEKVSWGKEPVNN